MVPFIVFPVAAVAAILWADSASDAYTRAYCQMNGLPARRFRGPNPRGILTQRQADPVLERLRRRALVYQAIAFGVLCLGVAFHAW